jgi:hypothetical protein
MVEFAPLKLQEVTSPSLVVTHPDEEEDNGILGAVVVTLAVV